MALFILIHGASANGHYWYQVKPLLEKAGHEVMCPDLPTDDNSADFITYAKSVEQKIGRTNERLIIVGQSMGAFTAPIVAQDANADMIILVDPMIPSPHETPSEWGKNTEHQSAMVEYGKQAGFDPSFDLVRTFMHDVPKNILDELMQAGEPRQSDTIFSKPFPLDTWPNIPTKVITGTLDRMFPVVFVQRLAEERLKIYDIATLESGHLPAFSQPEKLASLLLRAIG